MFWLAKIHNTPFELCVWLAQDRFRLLIDRKRLCFIREIRVTYRLGFQWLSISSSFRRLPPDQPFPGKSDLKVKLCQSKFLCFSLRFTRRSPSQMALDVLWVTECRCSYEISLCLKATYLKSLQLGWISSTRNVHWFYNFLKYINLRFCFRFLKANLRT